MARASDSDERITDRDIEIAKALLADNAVALEKRGRGRPRSTNARRHGFRIRLSDAELAKARRAKFDIAAYVRAVI
jgi:hypothetical protein